MPEQRPIQVLIITGMASGHHDYRATSACLRDILEETGRFEVKITEEFRGAGPETLAPYDLALVNYFGGTITAMWDVPEVGWGVRAESALADFVRSGKGALLYHVAYASGGAWVNDDYERMAGGVLRSGHGTRAPSGEFAVEIVDHEHPVTRGLAPSFWQVVDDFHYDLQWHPEVTPHVLASSVVPDGSNRQEPVAWTTDFGDGRVFTLTLGHGREAMSSAGFRALLERGAEWAATGRVQSETRPVMR